LPGSPKTGLRAFIPNQIGFPGLMATLCRTGSTPMRSSAGADEVVAPDA
jgi:hypothetical protein